MRERKSRNRAWHADGERRVARLCGIGFAFLVKKSVARDRRRRGLPIVDAGVAILAREMDYHVAAAAEIAGARIGDGERKAGRDRRIHGIAAPLQDFEADPRGTAL